MKLRDILTDPDFAGLHWSIPRTAPADVRECLHIGAALSARRTRNRNLHVFHPRDNICNRCGRSALDVHANRLECLSDYGLMWCHLKTASPATTAGTR